VLLAEKEVHCYWCSGISNFVMLAEREVHCYWCSVI